MYNVPCKSLSSDSVDTRHIFSYMILQIRSFGPNDEILYCMFDLFLSSVHCSKCWIFVKIYKSLQLLLYILMLRRDSCISWRYKNIFELTIELFKMECFTFIFLEMNLFKFLPENTTRIYYVYLKSHILYLI